MSRKVYSKGYNNDPLKINRLNYYNIFLYENIISYSFLPKITRPPQ